MDKGYTNNAAILRVLVHRHVQKFPVGMQSVIYKGNKGETDYCTTHASNKSLGFIANRASYAFKAVTRVKPLNKLPHGFLIIRGSKFNFWSHCLPLGGPALNVSIRLSIRSIFG